MFALTRQERQTILFLLAVALVGMTINFFTKINSLSETFACFQDELVKVNLNKANKELLMSIPGIGKKLAERIIEYREERRGFSSIEELKNIKGITPKRYEKIKDSSFIK